MEHPNFVYRNFNTPQDDRGEIEIFILPDNKLHIQVDGLHENYGSPYDGIDGPCSQADLVVKYYENLDLFTTITTILDKLTDDHRYYLGKNRKFTDLIHCFSKFVKDNSELPYIEYGDLQSSDKFTGWASLEFTPENMKYVGVSNRDYEDDKELITLYGEVNKDGLFTYDYPVISNNMGKEYYVLTRGHNVLRVQYEFDIHNRKLIIDPTFSKHKLDFSNYIYRDFNSLDGIRPGDYGEIEIIILPDNKLHIQVNSLHQNFEIDGHGGEAHLTSILGGL